MKILIYFNTTSLYTSPNFVNGISSPLTSMVIVQYCTFPLTKVSNLMMAY